MRTPEQEARVTPIEADAPSLSTLRHRAEAADRADAPEAWEIFWTRYEAECARRDVLRKLNAACARALGERVGRLPGVHVLAAEADDFGRAELRLSIGGWFAWTRPIEMADERGYKRLRDAVAAHRRRDWARSRRWLSHEAPPRSTVKWDGVERVRFARDHYGRETWR